MLAALLGQQAVGHLHGLISLSVRAVYRRAHSWWRIDVFRICLMAGPAVQPVGGSAQHEEPDLKHCLKQSVVLLAVVKDLLAIVPACAPNIC